MATAVLDNLKQTNSMESFYERIEDDVTHRSIKVGGKSKVPPPGTRKWQFCGSGSDGIVSANKSPIKLITYNNIYLYVLAYCLRI
jgi:hypothetical protein